MLAWVGVAVMDVWAARSVVTGGNYGRGQASMRGEGREGEVREGQVRVGRACQGGG